MVSVWVGLCDLAVCLLVVLAIGFIARHDGGKE